MADITPITKYKSTFQITNAGQGFQVGDQFDLPKLPTTFTVTSVGSSGELLAFTPTEVISYCDATGTKDIIMYHPDTPVEEQCATIKTTTVIFSKSGHIHETSNKNQQFCMAKNCDRECNLSIKRRFVDVPYIHNDYSDDFGSQADEVKKQYRELKMGVRGVEKDIPVVQARVTSAQGDKTEASIYNNKDIEDGRIIPGSFTLAIADNKTKHNPQLSTASTLGYDGSTAQYYNPTIKVDKQNINELNVVDSNYMSTGNYKAQLFENNLEASEMVYEGVPTFDAQTQFIYPSVQTNFCRLENNDTMAHLEIINNKITLENTIYNANTFNFHLRVCSPRTSIPHPYGMMIGEMYKIKMFKRGNITITGGSLKIKLVEVKNWKTVAEFTLADIAETNYQVFACNHPKYYIVFSPSSDFRMTSSSNTYLCFNIVKQDNPIIEYIEPVNETSVYPDDQFQNPGLVTTTQADSIIWSYPTTEFYIKRYHKIKKLSEIPLTYQGNYIAKSNQPLQDIVLTLESEYPYVLGANSPNIRPIPFNYLTIADPNSTGSIDEPISPMSYSDARTANNNLNYILGLQPDSTIVPSTSELRPINDTLNAILNITDRTYSIVFMAVDPQGYLYILNKDFTSQLAVAQFIVSEQITLAWKVNTTYTEPITVDSSSYTSTRSLRQVFSYLEGIAEPVDLIKLLKGLPHNCVINDDSHIDAISTFDGMIEYNEDDNKVLVNTYKFNTWSNIIIENTQYNCIVKIPAKGYYGILCCNKLEEKARGSQTTWYSWNNQYIYIYCPIDTFTSSQDFIDYATESNLYFIVTGPWREISVSGNTKSILGQNIITYYYKPATHIGEDNCPYFLPVVQTNYQKYYEDYPYGGEQGYAPSLYGNPPKD